MIFWAVLTTLRSTDFLFHNYTGFFFLSLLIEVMFDHEGFCEIPCLFNLHCGTVSMNGVCALLFLLSEDYTVEK